MMRYGVEIRRQEEKKRGGEAVQCFKYRSKEHQWRECPKKGEE